MDERIRQSAKVVNDAPRSQVEAGRLPAELGENRFQIIGPALGNRIDQDRRVRNLRRAGPFVPQNRDKHERPFRFGCCSAPAARPAITPESAGRRRRLVQKCQNSVFERPSAFVWVRVSSDRSVGSKHKSPVERVAGTAESVNRGAEGRTIFIHLAAIHRGHISLRRRRSLFFCVGASQPQARN